MATAMNSHYAGYDPAQMKASDGDKNELPEDLLYGTTVATSGASVRAGFIRKVYGVLACQLALTTFMCAAFMYVAPLRNFVISTGGGFQFLMFILTIGTIIGLMVYRNTSPANFAWLTAFTVAESLMLANICARYQAAGLGVLVLEALALTLGVFVTLTAYVVISKKDFSFLGGALWTALWILIGASVINLLFGVVGGSRSPFFSMLIACGGALIFSFYIIYDTWAIMNVLGPDEWVIGAVNLYLDLINLFIYILQILSEAQRN